MRVLITGITGFAAATWPNSHRQTSRSPGLRIAAGGAGWRISWDRDKIELYEADLKTWSRSRPACGTSSRTASSTWPPRALFRPPGMPGRDVRHQRHRADPSL